MSPGGGRRIFSETTSAPGGRRGIGSALTLLPLLVCCGLASPAPALTRRTRWAAGILVASLALLAPDLAKAQTTIDLVKNTDETAAVGFLNRYVGQRFRTGGNSTGYTLSEVKVVFESTSSGTTAVKIRENNASNQPGTVVATLTGTSGAAGTQTFTAPANTTLNANTHYWVTINDGTGSAKVLSTASGDEDGLNDWSMDNNGAYVPQCRNPLEPA